MQRECLIAMVFAGLFSLAGARAQQPDVPDGPDRRILEAFLEHARRVPERVSVEHCRQLVADEAEGVRWRILPYLEMPLTAYDITSDPSWLDVFVEAFGHLEAALTRGPDGFLGWYGKALPGFRHPDRPDQAVDVQINSFAATGMLSEFIERIDAQPALRRRHAAARARYLDLMVNHLVRKWNERSTYVEVGPRGAIYRTHRDLRPDKAHLTQPFNKLSDITRGLLALYRVTGDDRYMAQAVRIGTFFKRSLRLADDCYAWDYWNPAGAWDVHPDDPNRWKHWIGPEHRAGYYASSVALAVALYHHGVVFDETDIRRFLNTQLRRAWDGNLENPRFYRVDRSAGQMAGDYIAGSLAPWSEPLMELVYRGRGREQRLAAAAHPWQGGPAARGWLYGRFVYLPRAEGGRRIHAAHGERFRASPANRRLLAELEFTVEPPGSSPPRRPAEMRDMPPDPPVRGARR